MHGYYATVFDVRLSNDVDETIDGVKFKIRVLRVNACHHSVAIAVVHRLRVNPVRTRVRHVAVIASGFEWEVGWNPVVVDEDTWTLTAHRVISIWGHDPEGQTIIDKLARLKTAAASLVHDEDVIPALAGAGGADH